ncbi:hypothetical protein [Paraburkholderia sp. BL21I4N1]|uniref:hypothetical protein n=1 Tax=Paraburkholderia sp. BL21I4N1 TaxID=1938801 RepID=UPI000CFD2295|nr:hypothetical protein [Paraburkholderia sp. BL21I4N1]PQV50670.1 hypothetical protein B0G83_10529 [Paraburkholderia sp. BL21I4N1]
MEKPISAIATWFEKLPADERDNAAFLIYSGIAAMIGDKDYDWANEPGDAFLAWLRAPAGDPAAELAKLLLTREHVRFTLIDDFGTAEKWVEAEARNRAVLEKAQTDPSLSHLIPTAEKILARMPGHRDAAIKLADEWRTTIAPLITDERIRKWYDAALFEGITFATD